MKLIKVFVTLVVGIALGAAAVLFYSTSQGKKAVDTAADQIGSTAKSARDFTQEKLKVLDLRAEDLKDELAKTGQVIRRKARDVGQAIVDGTADARTTAAIKAKLFASSDLSSLSISVNTTAGVVTLSGTVNSREDIGKAMLLAMETSGVREVISTLQVKPRPTKAQ